MDGKRFGRKIEFCDLLDVGGKGKGKVKFD